MYYVLAPAEDRDGNMMGLNYKPDHRARSFVRGRPFAVDAGNAWERPPAEPIHLTVKPDRETAPLPSFLSQPVPLMSKKLYDTLRGSGVDNLDTYGAELYYGDGRLASSDYWVFNLIGLVRAADLSKSKYDSEQPDTVVSMSFDALAVSEGAARGLLMFRLAENLPTIIIHERVKSAIEAAEIPLIRTFVPEDIALP